MCEKENFEIDEVPGWRPDPSPTNKLAAERHRRVLEGAMNDAGVMVVAVEVPDAERAAGA